MVKDQLHELSAAIAALTEQVPAVASIDLRASLQAVINSAERELAALQIAADTANRAGHDDTVRPPIINNDATGSQLTTEPQQRETAAALVAA